MRCAFALLQGLAGAGVQTTVLCPAGEEDVSRAAGVTLEMVTVPPQTRAEIRSERLLAPRSRLRSGQFAARLSELSHEADVVHFIEATAAIGAAAVQRPAVSQLDCLTRLDPRSWNPLRAAGRDSIELLRAERRVLRDSRRLLVNSEELARATHAMSRDTEVSIAPLALEPSHYTPRAQLQEPLAGMIGWASWPPTKAAVERLLGSVWPRVLRLRPGSQLALAGVGMEASSFPHLAGVQGVQWHGFVPSATGFLRELGVMLYPLSRGSGTKVKVLEALALGIPVVTTARGREGVAGDAGIFTESEDELLARATAALLDDREARIRAGQEANESFMRGHTPVQAGAAVRDLYERMLT